MKGSVFFSQKQSSKRLSGDVYYSFDKPAGNFRQKSESFLLNVWKPKKLNFFSKKSSSKHSSGYLECSLDDPAELFQPIISNFSILKLRKWIKELLLQKKNFCSNSSPGQVKCSLINCVETFSPNFWKKLAGSQKRSVRTYIYIYIFSKKSFFFQNVPLDTQTAFLTSKPHICR